MRSAFVAKFVTHSDGPKPRGRARPASRWGGALAVAALLAALLPASVIAATYSISGTVTNAAGTGVAGIGVALCPLVPAPGQQYIQCLPEATTASDGTYAIANVPPGTFKAQFSDLSHTYPFGYYSAAGFTMSYSGSTNVVVSSADVAGIDIRYPAVYFISGTITGPDGSPVAGVLVSALVTGGDNNNTTGTSAADGTYSIAVTPLTIGTYTVEAFDNSGSFVPTFYSTAGSGGTATTLAVNSNVSGINIQFAPALHISGTLRAAVGGQRRFMNIFACSTGVTPGTCFYGGSQADGSFRIAVSTGTYLLSFVDFNGGVLSGYWSSHGLVANSAAATKVDVIGGDVTGLTASTMPIGVGAHVGITKAGPFTPRTAVVKRSSYVTIRFVLGKGFAGAKVGIWTAVGGTNGKLGPFRSSGSRIVQADGNVYYFVRVTSLMAFRARYIAASAIFMGSVYSASVSAKGL